MDDILHLPSREDIDAFSWVNIPAVDSDDSHSLSPDTYCSLQWARADSIPSRHSTRESDVVATPHQTDDQSLPLKSSIDASTNDDSAKALNSADVMASTENVQSAEVTSAATSNVTKIDLGLPMASNGVSLALALDVSISPYANHVSHSTPPMAASAFSENMIVQGHDHSADSLRQSAEVAGDMQWDESVGEQMAIPKLEPLDEDNISLGGLQEAPVDALSGNKAQGPRPSPARRPRGRPRKFGIAAPAPTAGKIAKGRSKTGCLTCRKRKKKCDETKPRCINCEKNAVLCEGYPEKQVWKSGRERAEEELLKSQSLPIITMQPIFFGLETAEDRILWKYYNDNLSGIFTVEGEQRNAFRDILVPLATRHQSMMHSILSLASRHIDYDEPTGIKVLRRNVKVSIDSLRRRGQYHNEIASRSFFQDIHCPSQDGPDRKLVLDVRYGQIICLMLECLAAGADIGSQQSYYEAVVFMLQNFPPQDEAYYSFVAEFLLYHMLADDLLFFPSPQTPPRLPWHHLQMRQTAFQPRLIGVTDGLLHFMCRITSIRERVRSRIASNDDPPVDYNSLYRASDIEEDIYEWLPQCDEGDSRERIGLLYKHIAWIYLKATVCPPTKPHQASDGMAETPSRIASSTSCVSSPSPTLEAMVIHDDCANNSRRHSVADLYSASEDVHVLQPTSMYASGHGGGESSEDMANLCTSPPPTRVPSNHDYTLHVAVEGTLAILESIGHTDAGQTLLLMPCVIIGASCYAPSEQDRIRKAISVIHGYTGLRNTAKALLLLDEIWRLMAAGEYLCAWDWQAVACRLGLHHLF